MPHRLDRRLGPELLAQPSDADVHNVRSGVEAVAPDLGEQALAAHDLACVREEVIQQAKLAIGEIGDAVFDASLPPCQIELESSDAHGRRILAASVAQLHAYPRDELVE